MRPFLFATDVLQIYFFSPIYKIVLFLQQYIYKINLKNVHLFFSCHCQLDQSPLAQIQSLENKPKRRRAAGQTNREFQTSEAYSEGGKECAPPPFAQNIYLGNALLIIKKKDVRKGKKREYGYEYKENWKISDQRAKNSGFAPSPKKKKKTFRQISNHIDPTSSQYGVIYVTFELSYLIGMNDINLLHPFL